MYLLYKLGISEYKKEETQKIKHRRIYLQLNQSSILLTSHLLIYPPSTFTLSSLGLAIQSITRTPDQHRVLEQRLYPLPRVQLWAHCVRISQILRGTGSNGVGHILLGSTR